MGQNNTAEEIFWTCLDKDSSFTKAWNGLAEIAIDKNNLKLAEEYLRNSLKIDPDNIFTLNNLIKILMDSERLNEAFIIAQKINTLEPDSSYSWAQTARIAEKLNNPLIMWESWFKAFRNARTIKDKKFYLKKSIIAGYRAIENSPKDADRIAKTMLRYIPQDSDDYAVYKKIISSSN